MFSQGIKCVNGVKQGRLDCLLFVVIQDVEMTGDGTLVVVIMLLAAAHVQCIVHDRGAECSSTLFYRERLGPPHSFL